MRKLIESLFDLFFPHDVDKNGNKIVNPDDDDSFQSKVIILLLLIIVVIIAGITLQ